MEGGAGIMQKHELCERRVSATCFRPEGRCLTMLFGALWIELFQSSLTLVVGTQGMEHQGQQECSKPG